jgi:hypothetical protein
MEDNMERSLINPLYDRDNVVHLLETHCDFSHEETVYVILAVTRKKLNQPYFKDHMSVSKVIRSLDNIDMVLDEIERVMQNRAYYLYVTVNARSVAKASMILAQEINAFIYHRQYEPLKKLHRRYVSTLMKPVSRNGKGYFLLDLDSQSLKDTALIMNSFNVILQRPTLNGYHFIVEKFNAKSDKALAKLKEVCELKRDDLLFLNAYVASNNPLN